MLFNINDFVFYNLEEETSGDLNLFFKNWKKGENVIFVSPHDDDVILGAAYLVLGVQAHGGVPYIAIMCDGRCGYSHPRDKANIIDRRRNEAFEAYKTIEIPPEHLIRFDIADFCLGSYKEWLLPGGERGVFEGLFKVMRQWKVTRMIIPNDYREHPDHLAASIIGSQIGPQVGDNILPDWGVQTNIKTYLKYSVWADFNPAEPANLAIKVKKSVEEKVREAVFKFESQKLVIDDLLKRRDERRIGASSLEIYKRFNPRPKLNYTPYISKVKKVDGK